VPEEQMDESAAQLLDKAILKRLEAGDSVVVPAKALDAEEREHYARMAAGYRRPRHLILIESARDQVEDEDRPALNELRRRLDAGELGQEGFQTALRLGGASVGEVRRLEFRPAPRDD
jgi:predicted kinase